MLSVLSSVHACIQVQVSFGSELLVIWADQYAQKASEVVSAAAEIPDAAERVVGVLLAPSDGWPHWVTSGASTTPGHHQARQLALVDALSQQLDLAAVLHSSRWLAAEVLIACCSSWHQPTSQWLAQEIRSTPEDAGMQMLGSLRERVLQAIVSELGEDASDCRAGKTMFAITTARCSLQQP